MFVRITKSVYKGKERLILFGLCWRYDYGYIFVKSKTYLR